MLNALVEVDWQIFVLIRRLESQKPKRDAMLNLRNCLLVGRIVIHNLHDSCLHSGEDEKTKEFEAHRVLVLECRSSRVISITHRCDHFTHPIDGEDVEARLSVPFKVIIRLLPW